MPQTTSPVPTERIDQQVPGLGSPTPQRETLPKDAASKLPPVAPFKGQRTYINGSQDLGRTVGHRFSTKPALLDNYHKTLNPNYRPLENSSLGRRKPLEASLSLSRPSLKSGSLSSESCLSLTISRSPSPYSTRSSTASTKSSCSSAKSNVSPYRVFPQTSSGQTSAEINQVMKQLEPSSVVFDANMSFFLGTTKQNVLQNMHPTPAHQDPETASNYLSSRISDFLTRTDHVMDEWKGLKKEKFPDKISSVDRDREARKQFVGRSRSVSNNIMVKGYQILQSNQLPPTSRSRPNSVCRESSILSDTDTLVDDQEEVKTPSESLFRNS